MIASLRSITIDEYEPVAVGISHERAALFEDFVHSGIERGGEFVIRSKPTKQPASPITPSAIRPVDATWSSACMNRA